jgi:hypothetical protein
MVANPSLPKSSGNFFINIIGVGVCFYVYLLCRHYEVLGVTATLLLLASYGFSVTALQALFQRSPLFASTGLDFNRMQWSLSRSAFKLAGVYGSYGFVALLYWIFPEYHGSFYDSYYEALHMVLPVILVLAIPYVAYIDACMTEPEDSYHAFGRLLLGYGSMTTTALLQHLLGWIMRGHFVALLFTYANDSTNEFLTSDFSTLWDGIMAFFPFALSGIFLLALIVHVSGTILTLRLFDTHIRSIDPTTLGWMVCLICFQPFRGIADLYLDYPGNDDNWINLMGGSAEMEAIWAMLLLVVLTCVVLSDISLGNRYSNLTHRGIVTGGMYRFSKHPNYIAQNLFWIMTILPFCSDEGFAASARYTVVYIGIMIIYFLRARTEERHLSHDPQYVAYALWMNENGIFRHIGKWIPILRYQPPRGWSPASLEQRQVYEGLK